jgi:uncharacterized membrane protein (UPF0127 family)
MTDTVQRLGIKGRSISKVLFSRMPFFSRKKTNLHQLGASIKAVKIGDTVMPVEVVVEKAAIDKGLSGREQLGASEGMLFMFDHTARFRFWMRKMHFPLDLVWINADMRIVDISKNIPPLPDDAEAFFYSPAVPAQYVLEVNANFCDTQEIRLGDSVEFISS